MATSTTTEPGFINLIISRRTTLGAEAPGTNTAPITKSACRNASRTVCVFDASVTIWPL